MTSALAVAPCSSSLRALRPSSGRPSSRRAANRQRVFAASGDELAREFAKIRRSLDEQAAAEQGSGQRMQAPPRSPQSTPRRVGGGGASGGWNDGPSASQMRRQEAQLLNAWTSERGMQLAAAGTMVLVIALLLSAGGPPADARCTLPWC